MVRILGTGAHSTIWEVRHERTGQAFAMKRVVRRGEQDARFFQQAVNEFQVARRIDHPNIRKIFSLQKIRRFFSTRELHLLMEFCPGASLQEKPSRTPLEACGVFAQVAHALGRMNQAGFVHADMKPNNVIVDVHGNVKIIDLGHSCPTGTVKQRIQGTPDYIAPEQVQRLPLDARTDVYNFGASFYWVLGSKPLPSVLPPENGLRTSLREPIGSLRRSNPEISPALEKLVMDCVRLEPSERPESMEDVARRLGILISQELNT